MLIACVAMGQYLPYFVVNHYWWAFIGGDHNKPCFHVDGIKLAVEIDQWLNQTHTHTCININE